MSDQLNTPSGDPEETPEEKLLDTPTKVPGQAGRPAGAWSSLNQSSAEKTTAPEPAPFSDQSLHAIQTIYEALKEPACNQVDSYGPGLVSALVNGMHREMRGVRFASTDEYLNFIKLLVDHAASTTSWRKIKDENMGVLRLPATTAEFLRRFLESNGRTAEPATPAAAVPSRLTVFLSPPGEHATFSIRKHTARSLPGTQFVEQGMMDQRMWDFLVSCVRARANMLFVGEMGSGKTTLLRALAQYFGDNEKIAVVEEIPELHLPRNLVVPYTYQPTVEGLELSTVLDRNLYNGVNRLIVGETHLEGLTKMLETMIFTTGSMSTYHAFSTEQAGERMKLALQMENPNVTAETAVSLIRQALEIVVVLQMVNGRRRVVQITELDWRASAGKDMLGGRDIFKYEHGEKGRAGRFRAENPPDPRGRVVNRAMHQVAPPVVMDHRWFLEPEHLQMMDRHR
jgi:Flp pilus assembly CpaF family ATPase